MRPVYVMAEYPTFRKQNNLGGSDTEEVGPNLFSVV